MKMDRNGSISERNEYRPMLSRKEKNRIEIPATLQPAIGIPCCLAIFTAPSCCPMLGLCCCCKDAEYITAKKSSSEYIWIRENSIEWNEPHAIFRQGSCCGIDPCYYDIKDNVNVLYYDDPMFVRISDQTRVCNECRTCLFGGRGETVQIDSPCCHGLCHRASFPCLYVPACCPLSLAPCALRYEIHIADAQKGMYEIKKAVQAARCDAIYTDNNTVTKRST
jgi:hypothetical protein